MENNPSNTNQPTTEQLLSGVTPGQPTKFVFGGQEWDSPQAAEVAYAQYIGTIQAERDALKKQTETPQPPATTSQYVKGDEPVGYDHAQFLRQMGENGPDAIDYVLKAKLFGNTAVKVSPIELMREVIQTSMKNQAELAAIKLQQAHPEINFNDEKQREVIAQYQKNYGLNVDFNGTEAAIALAQRDNRLASRQAYDAYMQRQQQEIAAQYGQRQMQPENPYNVAGSTMPMPGSTTAAYPNVIPMQGPYNPGPPQFGPGRGAPQGMDLNALIEKMQDPNTPTEEVRRIGDAIRKMNPASMVG